MTFARGAPYNQEIWHCGLFQLCDKKSNEKICSDENVDLANSKKKVTITFSIGRLIAEICRRPTVKNRGFVRRHCANLLTIRRGGIGLSKGDAVCNWLVEDQPRHC